LYTTSSGVRRIRVHTLCLPITTSPLLLYQSVDVRTTWNLLVKMAIDRLLQTSLESARSFLMDALVHVLQNFLNFLTQDQRSANQLLLPDSLLTLPVVINALLKNPTLRNDADTPPDERCAYIARAMTVGTANTLQFFHPRLYNLGRTLEMKSPAICIPSQNQLDPASVYLVDNSFHLAVWVGRRAAPELLQALFGTQTLKEIEGFAPENPMNSPVIKLVEELQQCKHGLGNLPVIIILQGSSQEKPFVLVNLTEDEAPNSMSYSNFLCHLHRRIQAAH
jgi:protein transport protein SEC24